MGQMFFVFMLGLAIGILLTYYDVEIESWFVVRANRFILWWRIHLTDWKNPLQEQLSRKIKMYLDNLNKEIKSKKMFLALYERKLSEKSIVAGEALVGEDQFVFYPNQDWYFEVMSYYSDLENMHWEIPIVTNKILGDKRQVRWSEVLTEDGLKHFTDKFGVYSWGAMVAVAGTFDRNIKTYQDRLEEIKRLKVQIGFGYIPKELWELA